MAKYVIKRILQALPTFLGITFLVYVMSSLAPGSVIDTYRVSATEGLTEEALRQLEISLGLDKPIVVRYLIWLKDLIQGDLGISYRTMLPVMQLLSQRIGPTIILSCSGLLLAILISLPLGVLSASKPYSLVDHTSGALGFIGASVPNFFAGLLLIYIFAVKLGVLPAQGMYYNNQPQVFANLLKHLLMPSFVISLALIGNFLKQVRGSVLEVMNEDYVKTARSKGLREHQVIIRHALRNALIPIVTTIGLSVPVLVGGTVIVEQVFSWPGLGSFLVSSIVARDYPAIMGVTVIISIAVLGTNILIDVIYAYLDPRIRLS